MVVEGYSAHDPGMASRSCKVFAGHSQESLGFAMVLHHPWYHKHSVSVHVAELTVDPASDGQEFEPECDCQHRRASSPQHQPQNSEIHEGALVVTSASHSL